MNPTPVQRVFVAAANLVAVLLLFTITAFVASAAAATSTVRSDSGRELKLAFFSGRPTGGGVVLSWRNGPEVGLAGFNVYRAQGADAWGELNGTLIAATGGLAERNDYSWTDATAKAGQNYFYRLEHVMKDGATKQYEPIKIRAGAPLRLGLDEFNPQMLASLWPSVLGAMIAVGGFSLFNRRR